VRRHVHQSSVVVVLLLFSHLPPFPLTLAATDWGSLVAWKAALLSIFLHWGFEGLKSSRQSIMALVVAAFWNEAEIYEGGGKRWWWWRRRRRRRRRRRGGRRVTRACKRG